jgi:hypothetical protein
MYKIYVYISAQRYEKRKKKVINLIYKYFLLFSSKKLSYYIRPKFNGVLCNLIKKNYLNKIT